jgi:hypothetical protein
MFHVEQFMPETWIILPVFILSRFLLNFKPSDESNAPDDGWYIFCQKIAQRGANEACCK